VSSLWAVVPAAGFGRRMAAEVPKQYLSLAGHPLLEHTLRSLLSCAEIRGVVVVLDPADRRADNIPSLYDPRVLRAAGGAERADSVLSGLESLVEQANESDWVLVHDAARPCLPLADLQRLIDTAKSTGRGTILAQPCNDTMKRVDVDGAVLETVDRERLWRAQTPQMFPLGPLRQALAQCREHSVAVTDEAMAMEWAGHTVALIEGPLCNIKVTLPHDLKMAEWFLKSMSVESSA
jgi:2-C-methyl-D-erythritol 4-phosphate cytidylyltransferase